MKQKDHKALAYYLLDSVGDCRIWQRRWHRRVFLWGCVCPDYIPFTYLRGFRQSHAMLGHNARYSLSHIQKSIRRLQERGVFRFRDCYRLGTLMHYLADSFTYPHTDGFCGDLRAHRVYEADLHGLFPAYLRRVKGSVHFVSPRESLSDLLLRKRASYEKKETSCEWDCMQIVRTCTEVFGVLCGVKIK